MDAKMYANYPDIFDVIIVGTGAAGLYTALSLPDRLNIMMITKSKIENSDSYLAQGGISTLLNEEDYTLYFDDTMKAGHFKNSKDSVEAMIRASSKIIEDLIKLGVEFDKDEEGNLKYTKEGGHSTNRILHHKDITGREIVTKLINKTKEQKNITILEETTMLDIIEYQNSAKGIVMYNKEKNSISNIYAKAIVLATGGIGGVFKSSTNFPHITGDSFAIALKHKIELENIDYIQIHPTVLYTKEAGRRFLISESVRGEGAVLLNEKKQRFVDELLPRDVVTNAIIEQMEKYKKEYVYLSLLNMDKDLILEHFPNIYNKCVEIGIDPFKDLIKVTPAQHYLMGGIKTDLYGHTTLNSLFAIGETACNGVHGYNRLASNSLLETLVFGEKAAKAIENESKKWSCNLLEIKEKMKNNINNDKFDIKKWKKENEMILLEEIKRRDKEKYDKWCK